MLFEPWENGERSTHNFNDLQQGKEVLDNVEQPTELINKENELQTEDYCEAVKEKLFRIADTDLREVTRQRQRRKEVC